MTRYLHMIFTAMHTALMALFICSAVILLLLAGQQLLESALPFSGLARLDRLNEVLDSIALLTIAVAALELGQTILEEQVQRAEHLNAPTRVRRFLSRFMLVVVVALSIETLVTVFRYSRISPEELPRAGIIAVAAAAMLIAWGVFIKLNRAAEELEPEAMEQAKNEDARVAKHDE